MSYYKTYEHQRITFEAGLLFYLSLFILIGAERFIELRNFVCSQPINKTRFNIWSTKRKSSTACKLRSRWFPWLSLKQVSWIRGAFTRQYKTSVLSTQNRTYFRLQHNNGMRFEHWTYRATLFPANHGESGSGVTAHVVFLLTCTFYFRNQTTNFDSKNWARWKHQQEHWVYEGSCTMNLIWVVDIHL